MKMIKKLIYLAINSLGINNAVLSKKKGSALILAYHRIQPTSHMGHSLIMPGMFVSAEAFEKQICWLKDEFTIVSLEKIIMMIRNKERWEKKICAITFDDGYLDNFLHAYPILKKFDIPATIFLIDDYVGKTQLNCWDLCFEIVKKHDALPGRSTGNDRIDFFFNRPHKDPREKIRKINNEIRKLLLDDFLSVYNRLEEIYKNSCNDKRKNNYQYLGWPEINEMGGNNIDFAYHSKSHYMLPNLPENILRNELMLPEMKNSDCNFKLKKFFCYPDGKYNAKTIQILKEFKYLGATSLLTGYNRLSTDPYQLRRITIHQSMCEKLAFFISNIGIKMVTK